MTDLIAWLGDLLILQFVQVTLLILLVGLATRLFCRNRPYLALALWSIALIKCLLPPVVYSPCGVFCKQEPVALEHRQFERKLQAGVIASNIAEYGPTATVNSDNDAWDQTARRSREVLAPATAERTLWRERIRVHFVQWRTMGLTLWIAGTLIMALHYVVGSLQFLRRIEREHRGANVSFQVPVEQLVRRLSRYLGLRRVPRLVLSNRNVGPAVFGILRPTMVLPIAMVETSTTRELTPIVLHELLHVRRGDLFLALWSAAARAIWWFHPLVWWSVRRATWESERCCDEAVVSCMPRSPARYAHSLINALEQSHRLRTSSLVPGVRPVDITANRLERIMRMGQGSHRRMPATYWIVAILAAALVLPGAAGGLAQTPDSKEQTGVENLTRLPDARQPDGSEWPVQRASHETLPILQGMEGAANRTGHVVVRRYDVADLLKKLKRDENMPEHTPADQLQRMLEGHLMWSFSHQRHAALGLPPVAQNKKRLWPQAQFAWIDGQLVVSGSEAAQEIVSKEIELRRKLSFRQVTVEVRIMKGPPSLCRQGPDPNGNGASWRDRWILFPQEYANLESVPSLQAFAAFAEGGDAPRRPAASVSSGKYSPVVYQFADDRQLRSFINDYEDNERKNVIVLAPKVTLFDGQVAEISDTSQRPFVTDVSKVVGDHAEAYQPIIQVFWEGTKIQLAPTITDSGHRLKCRFKFASIDDCKTFRAPSYPDAKDVSIQHPVVSSSEFECDVDIPAGRSLLVGGLFPCEEERVLKQGTISRWLGRQPTKITRDQVTYIAISLRTVVPE